MVSGRSSVSFWHGQDGKLVAYAGRIVDDGVIDEETPKYKFPPKRERKGLVYEFQKSRVLYGGHHVPGQVDELIVVEGFPSVWWLWQAGYKNVVALMGSSCSDTQAELIAALVSSDGGVLIVPDADEAGTRCAESLLLRVSPYRFTKWVKLDSGKQPTDCGTDVLGKLLGTK